MGFFTYGFLEGIVIEQKIHDGGVYLKELTDELKEQGYTEDDVREEGVDCVVFYPGGNTTMLEAVLTSGVRKE